MGDMLTIASKDFHILSLFKADRPSHFNIHHSHFVHRSYSSNQSR